MDWTLEFFIEGIPSPGGSKSAYVPTNKKTGQPYRRPGGAIIVNVVDAGGQKTKEWRKVVALTAKKVMREAKLEMHRGPVIYDFAFLMNRPKSDFNSKGQLKADAPRHHIKTPDALKLARSTEDALSSIVWEDDSQVIDQRQTKCYTSGESGCYVKLAFLPINDDPALAPLL